MANIFSAPQTAFSVQLNPAIAGTGFEDEDPMTGTETKHLY